MNIDELRRRLALVESQEAEVKRFREEWLGYKAELYRLDDELKENYAELGRLIAEVGRAKAGMSDSLAEMRKTLRLIAQNREYLTEAVDEIEGDNWWKGDDLGDADSWKNGPE